MRLSAALIPSSIPILLGLMKGMIRGLKAQAPKGEGQTIDNIARREVAMRFSETNWLWRMCISPTNLGGASDWTGGGVLADLRVNEFFLPGFIVASKSGSVGLVLRLEDLIDAVKVASEHEALNFEMFLLRSRLDVTKKELKFVISSATGTLEKYIPVTVLSSAQTRCVTVPSEIPSHNVTVEVDISVLKRITDRLSTPGLGTDFLQVSLRHTKFSQLENQKTTGLLGSQKSAKTGIGEACLQIVAEGPDFDSEVLIPAILNRNSTPVEKLDIQCHQGRPPAAFLGIWRSGALNKTVTAAHCILSDTCIAIICPKKSIILYLYLPDDMKSHAVCFIDASEPMAD